MDNIAELVFALMFLVFAGFAFVKRTIEGRDIEKRNQEPDFTAEDIPEETRRMLFGDSGPRTARPAQPRQSEDPFVQVRDIFNELRKQVETQTAKPRNVGPQTAQPRQGARPGPPALPQAPRPQRQVHQQQPQYQPQQHQQQPPRAPVPPRQAPRPQPPRMVPQQSEGAMQRPIQVQKPRPAPMARRQQQPPPVRAAQQVQSPHAQQHAPRQRKSRAQGQHSRWLSHPGDLRRGIVLSEILGPPKALQDY